MVPALRELPVIPTWCGFGSFLFLICQNKELHLVSREV